jgi:hypothetical protein
MRQDSEGPYIYIYAVTGGKSEGKLSFLAYHFSPEDGDSTLL